MRTTRLMLAASGLATVALLGSSAAAYAASPKVTNGPNYTTHVAGYELASGDVQFNQVRATAHITAGDTTDPVLALQSTVNGGITYAIRLHLVGGSFVLQAASDFVNNAQTGTFDPASIPSGAWFDVAGGPSIADNLGGSAYLEVRESTGGHVINIVAGPSETDTATLTFHWSFTGKLPLYAPAVEGWNPDAAALGLNEPEINFTRVGVTTPAGVNPDGIKAGQRITFDFFNVDETLATLFGGGPGVANPLTLVTGPALPQTSSDFGLVGGAL
jgi:hypothetical protein